MPDLIQLRRGIKADWLASTVILAVGEPGIALDTGDIRFGDGVNTWTNLPHAAAASVAWVDITGKPTTFAPTPIVNASVAVGAAIDLDKTADSATRKALTDTERTKLSGIATAATANLTDAVLVARSSHTGTQTADTITDGTTNKVFTATQSTKLSGIATGATVNSPDATLLARANHTGTQLAATISDFATAAVAALSASLAAKLSNTEITQANAIDETRTTTEAFSPRRIRDAFVQAMAEVGQPYTVFWGGASWPALSTVNPVWIATGKPIIWDSQNDEAAIPPPEARDGDYWDKKLP